MIRRLLSSGIALAALASCHSDEEVLNVTIREFAGAPASELAPYELARFAFRVDARAEDEVSFWVNLYRGHVDESSTQEERDSAILCEVSDSRADAFSVLPLGQRISCSPVSDPDHYHLFDIEPGMQEFTLEACMAALDLGPNGDDKPKLVSACDYATVTTDVRDIQLEQPAQ